MSTEDYKALVDIVKRNGFSESIDALMDANVIGSIDILSIADEIYDNGENPIEQIDNIMEFERQKTLNDPTKSMISLENMMHDIMFVYYDRDDIIKYFDNDELLNYLENSFELENYVEDKVEEAENDLRNEFNKEFDELYDAIQDEYCIYTIDQYCDLRYSTNLTRFTYDPFDGSKINWKEVKNELMKMI